MRISVFVRLLRLLATAVALAGLVQAASSVFDFYLVSLEGKSVPLKQYDGKVLLIVNLATKTEYKDQIPKLEALYEKYEPQGLMVIGIPSNEFGAGQRLPKEIIPVLIAYCVAQILAQIPLTPGGLGFVEAGLAATLVLAGVSASEAALATLAYRVFSYWLPLPVGLAAALAFRHRYGRDLDVAVEEPSGSGDAV